MSFIHLTNVQWVRVMCQELYWVLEDKTDTIPSSWNSYLVKKISNYVYIINHNESYPGKQFWGKKKNSVTKTPSAPMQLNLRDTVLGGKKNSFIALPGKGGHSWLLPSKTVYLVGAEGLGEELYINKRIRVCGDCISFMWPQVGLLLRSCGSQLEVIRLWPSLWNEEYFIK